MEIPPCVSKWIHHSAPVLYNITLLPFWVLINSTCFIRLQSKFSLYLLILLFPSNLLQKYVWGYQRWVLQEEVENVNVSLTLRLSHLPFAILLCSDRNSHIPLLLDYQMHKIKDIEC